MGTKRLKIKVEITDFTELIVGPAMVRLQHMQKLVDEARDKGFSDLEIVEEYVQDGCSDFFLQGTRRETNKEYEARQLREVRKQSQEEYTLRKRIERDQAKLAKITKRVN